MVDRAREKISELTVGAKVFVVLFFLTIVLYVPAKQSVVALVKWKAERDEDHRILLRFDKWMNDAPFGYKH